MNRDKVCVCVCWESVCCMTESVCCMTESVLVCMCVYAACHCLFVYMCVCCVYVVCVCVKCSISLSKMHTTFLPSFLPGKATQDPNRHNLNLFRSLALAPDPTQGSRRNQLCVHALRTAPHSPRQLPWRGHDGTETWGQGNTGEGRKLGSFHACAQS